MKSDRELLELAAKACGELPESWYGNNAYFDGVLTRWNPLTDDGDALRLAVKLKLQIIIHENWVEVLQDGICVSNADSVYSAGCMLETTRRAIVRAAAAIGESM